MKRTILASLTLVALLTVLSQPTFAQFANTPFDRKTWRDTARNTPVDRNTWRVPSPPRSGGYEQTWRGESTTQEMINQDGSVSRREVYNDGRATQWRTFDRAIEKPIYGRMCWVYSSAKNSPLPVIQNANMDTPPQPVNVTQVFNNPPVQTFTEYKFRIEPANGMIYRGTFVNGNYKGEDPMNQRATATMNFSDGRWYWMANGCQPMPMPVLFQ